MQQQPGSEPALWWQAGVVYQIYPRSFQDSNGDGIGDLRGIIGRLDYLSDTLGVDAIWISPFYPSPMADFGYDVADYCDVDPIFGTLADFDELLDEAHRRGLRVIIDWVPNHTSDQHPWFQESRASRDNPRHDWYIWADPKPDGAPPNNWLATFGGSAWTFDPGRGQYYLHLFLPEQPDINWRNPAARAAMLDTLRFWLERGVDGFRIDVAHRLLKDPELRDNPPNPDVHGSVHKSLGEYDAQLHIHDGAHPDIHPLYREIRSLLDAYSAQRPRVSIGEIHVFEWEVWSRFYGAELDELHLPFNFGLLGVPWSGLAVRELVDILEAAIPNGGWPNYVLGNHDEHRIASRVGPEQARLALMLLLTLRGTPTLYYGDELGMQNVPIPDERVQDPWGKRVAGLGLGRDPERTPMQWDDSPNAGFCPAGVEPWLPLATDYRECNVAAQLGYTRSILWLTCRLLQLRRASPALSIGAYRPVEEAPGDCFAFVREEAGERLAVLLNFSDNDLVLQLPALGRGSIVVATGMQRDGEADLGHFELYAHEGCVVRLATGN